MTYLIVGLGNPGEEYAETRHNFGFSVADAIGEEAGAEKLRTKLQSQIFRIGKNNAWGIADIGGTIIMKPQTFMNLSGEVAAPFAKKEKIGAERMIIIHDDLDIPFGEIRVSRNASSGGHNGVQSIIDSLGTQDFTRIRLGIGRPPENVPADKFVLQRFTAEEKAKIPDITAKAISEIKKIFSE